MRDFGIRYTHQILSYTHAPSSDLMSTMAQHSHRFMTVRDMLAEANDSVRHKSPISPEELESMVDFVLDTRALTAKSNPEWSFQVSSSNLNFIKQIDESTGVLRSRSWIKVDDVPPQVLFYCLYDPTTRMAFDKFYDRFQVSRRVEPGLDVLISEIDTPMGLSNREFLEWRRCRLPDLSRPPASRSSIQYVIYLRSCADAECSTDIRPSTKKVERAEVWLSGYVIQWWLDENGQPLGSELLVMSQIDSRGHIPKFLANSATSSSPSKWALSLTEAAKKLCASKNIDMKMSDAEIEKCLGVCVFPATPEERGRVPVESN